MRHCTQHFWKYPSEYVSVPSTFQIKLTPMLLDFIFKFCESRFYAKPPKWDVWNSNPFTGIFFVSVYQNDVLYIQYKTSDKVQADHNFRSHNFVINFQNE